MTGGDPSFWVSFGTFFVAIIVTLAGAVRIVFTTVSGSEAKMRTDFLKEIDVIRDDLRRQDERFEAFRRETSAAQRDMVSKTDVTRLETKLDVIQGQINRMVAEVAVVTGRRATGAYE